MLDFFYKYGLVIELFAALFLFTINLKKRKWYLLRNILLVLAIALFCFLRYTFPTTTIFSKIVSYIILYIVCFAFNYFIYDAPFRIIVYCTISGITAQHASYIISDFLRYVVVLHSSDILGNIIYTISTIVIYASLFFLFSFKQDPRDFNKLQRGTIIISTFIIFVIF